MTQGAAQARPFLKWAGGKGQLIAQMSARFPAELGRGDIHTYVEPFLGGGAPFFHIAPAYDVERLFIADVNEDLILTYRTIQRDINCLVDRLYALQTAYLALGAEERKNFFYRMRSCFNLQRRNFDYSAFSSRWTERSAQAIFLNKTCFNGSFASTPRASSTRRSAAMKIHVDATSPTSFGSRRSFRAS